ncbi:MAG: VCBS repeat-containing protein [Kofleriaceae bacterium]
MTTNKRAGLARGRGGWGALVVLAMLAACGTESQQYTPLPPTVPHLRMPRNDLYISSFRPNALRPTFVWEPATATVKDPVRYELQLSADKTFETDVVTAETLTPTFQPDQDLPIATTPPVGRRYYWRVRACLPLICSDYSPTWWINLGRSKKDFNGDGYADVAVATPGFNNGDGRVEVYFGSPGATFDATSDGTLTGDRTGELFGYRLAAAEDFNADGFADLLVGARGIATGAMTPGRGYLYFGSPGTSFDPVPDVIFQGTPDESFAAAVAGAGDFNGDGFSDVAIGARSNSARGLYAGRAYLYYGDADGTLDQADSVLTGEMRLEEFGSGISSGDLNGDGLSDLVVLASDFPDEYRAMCAAQVYLGESGSKHSGSRTLSLRHEDFPTCVSIATVAGDINRDGFTDIVHIINSTNDELLNIHLGRPIPQATPDVSTARTSTPDSRSWNQVAKVGDINGDGFDDVAIQYYSGPSLRTDVLLGKGLEDGLFSFALATTIPSGSAVSLAAAGDVNGDGYDDIIAKVPARPTVYLYFGAAGGTFDISPDGTLTSQTEVSFGEQFASRAR